MTEHVKCSNCKCKSINEDEHIDIDFVYNRLGSVINLVLSVEIEESKSVAKTERTFRKKENIIIIIKSYAVSNHARVFNKKNRQPADCETCCTRCYKHKPLAEFGQYESSIKVDDVVYSNNTM